MSDSIRATLLNVWYTFAEVPERIVLPPLTERAPSEDCAEAGATLKLIVLLPINVPAELYPRAV